MHQIIAACTAVQHSGADTRQGYTISTLARVTRSIRTGYRRFEHDMAMNADRLGLGHASATVFASASASQIQLPFEICLMSGDIVLIARYPSLSSGLTVTC